ncbi:MAG: type I secretion system permease/ATPase, partial [Pseudomonadota bacterium]
MADEDVKKGKKELRDALFSSKKLLVGVGLFSVFVNILMLTGPLFMLNVYDRVLASNSLPTLYAMFVLITFLFLFMGLLDHARARVLSRAGARFQTLLDRRVFDAVLRRSVAPSERTKPQSGLRDLETIQRVLSSPAPFAIFDMPWTPIFLAIIFSFHWTLGVLAIGGGLLLMLLTWLNEISSRKPMAESQMASAQSEAFSEALRRDGETVQALGMRGSALGKWRKFRENALTTAVNASDSTGGFSTASKTLRFFLQSAMLAVGAGLAIQQVISPGMMIAASILMGRALAPIEQAIGQWSNVQRAMDGWGKLAELLGKTPEQSDRTPLPAPKGKIDVQGLTIVAPGERAPTLRNVSFAVEPGKAVGVIGPSAAGKSTLARALVNIWKPAQGKIRLDGAALDQFEDDVLGSNMGYLPQDVALFEASVAENIARLADDIDPEAVVTAAKRAGAHDMILKLPGGYDTPAGPSGGRLSGGQRQRIALARALYKDPAVLVLDEPNSNLDSLGEAALVNAIREAKERGRTVIIMAHRPSAIAACDYLLVLEGGAPRA